MLFFNGKKENAFLSLIYIMKGGDEMKQLLSGLFLFLIGILLFNMVDENKNIVFDSKNSFKQKEN